MNYDSFGELFCGFSDDKHFSKNPIKLRSCSHSVCKNCLVENKNKTVCKICGMETSTNDLNINDDVSIELKKAINSSLNKLFEILDTRMSSQIEILKRILTANKKRISLIFNVKLKLKYKFTLRQS